MSAVEVEGKKILISNPEKLLWPDIGIRKVDYIKTLLELAPYLLPHTADKPLTALRYPNGVNASFFYQKRPPKGTPDWVDILTDGDDTFINLNNLATLVWLGNLAALEFHTPFCGADGMLSALVFDLDPSQGQTFDDVRACALKVYETLDALGIASLPKTSGASGLQVYIPTRSMTFEQGRAVNEFFGRYFVEKFPKLMTIERQVKKRGGKLYFDYLQMAQGKNIVSVYSPRAVPCGAVSMPLTWHELKSGAVPCGFNLRNAAKRLAAKGDMVALMQGGGKSNPALEEILKKLNT